MDKTYLGRSIEDFAPGIESKPITKVELLDENGDIVGVAGTDSGKTLTAQTPDGTNEMAQAILAKVSGYTHIGYEGQNAMIDPAAEIGDAVTVSGHYVPIVSTDSIFDSLLAVNISAPDSDELDDEYPYKSPTQRQIERNMVKTRSLITKTSEEIMLKVEGIEIPDPEGVELMGTTLSPNGKFFGGVGYGVNEAWIYDMESKKFVAFPAADAGADVQIKSMADNGVAVGWNGPAATFDFATEQCTQYGENGQYTFMGISPNGKLIVGAHYDGDDSQGTPCKIGRASCRERV